jgi:hypothetical protein
MMDRNATTRRFVEWGHWALTFCQDTHVVASLAFPVSAGGPSDGTVGSPEREAYREACRAWIARGELPASAVSADRALHGARQ